jgi:hypothetical protein
MTEVMRAPDAGWRFRYRGRTYRVTGWCKPMPPPAEPSAGERNFPRDLIDDLLYTAQQEVGPDRCRLVCCGQDEAEYVCGVGVAGCIARLADIEVLGPVAWPLAQLDEAREQAERLAGTVIW